MPALASQAFTTAITGVTSAPVTGLGDIGALSLVASFTSAGGGTTAFVRIQTSLDGGVTWYDIARFDFTTTTTVKRANVEFRSAVAPTGVGSLGAEGAINGLIGDRLRCEFTTTGTYTAGTNISVVYFARD